MDEQKIRRVVAASVVIAVVLLCALLTFMVYQMFLITEQDRIKKDLDAQIEQLKEEMQDKQDTYDIWVSEWKIEERARERGWYYPSDK